MCSASIEGKTKREQLTLGVPANQGQGFEFYRKPIRRDTLLGIMEETVLCSVLCVVIEPHYLKAGNGRLPVRLERRLRPAPACSR